MVSRVFSCKTLQVSLNNFRFRSWRALDIHNLSNCSKHKYDQSISRIFGSNFWRVFAIWSNCVARFQRSSNFRESTAREYFQSNLCRFAIGSLKEMLQKVLSAQRCILPRSVPVTLFSIFISRLTSQVKYRLE